MTIIITKQDIINTYDERQQEQCRLYFQYKKISEENPTFGYKRIAKLMGQPQSKTRWWHNGRHIPTPIQTANWLEKKGLLPLTSDHPNIDKICKMLGASFGDGGVFENLNAIFLSSSELVAVQEFGKDLYDIFGEELAQNHRIIESGEYGHSWCYQNTNRNVIRFFVALGSPKGKKTLKDLKIPAWVELNQTIKDAFFGALLGSEVGIPKVHISGRHLNTLSFAITSQEERDENRFTYLERIRVYLSDLGIKVGIARKRYDEKKSHYKYRIDVSTTLENVTNFSSRVPMYYTVYKNEKLKKTVSEFWEIKKKRFRELLSKGLYKEEILQKLRLEEKHIDETFYRPSSENHYRFDVRWIFFHFLDKVDELIARANSTVT